jgi:hypothetical protein
VPKNAIAVVPHLVGPKFRQHEANVAAGRIKALAGCGKRRQLGHGFARKRAVEGEKEQLPPWLIAEGFHLGPRIGKAALIGGNRNPRIGDVDPIWDRLRRVQHKLVTIGLNINCAITRHNKTGCCFVIGDDIASPKINRRDIALNRHPFRQLARWIGALFLALDSHGQIPRAVIAGDMGFVRPEI